jgi:hypothetical protein
MDIHVLRHTLIVTYFVAVYFKETLASAPCIWRDNNIKTCRIYVKDNTRKSHNSSVHSCYRAS